MPHLEHRRGPSQQGQRRFDPALAAAIVAALCWPATTIDLANGAVRAMAAVLLVLVLPGYALAEAALPAGGIGPWERLTLAAGLSAAAAALGGLVLHLTPWGLQPWTWSPLLVTITLAASAVAVARRRWPAPAAGRLRLGTFNRQAPLLLGMAALFAIAAWMAARAGAAAVPGTGYTQLWMLPAALDGRPAVRLGVRSAERRPLTYRLELRTDGGPLRAWEAISLQPGQQWETIEPLPAVSPEGMVSAALYRSDQSGVYRHVAVWPSAWLSPQRQMRGGGAGQ